MTLLLRLTIENAISKIISKKRFCNQSKVSTNQRKFMIYSKKQWKNFKIQSD